MDPMERNEAEAHIAAARFSIEAATVDEARRHRRHSALAHNLSGGRAPTTTWETANKMEEQTFSLAVNVGDTLLELHTALVRMRDEMRVALANFQRHGAEGYSTDTTLETLFPSTTAAMVSLQRSFRQVSSMFSSSIRLVEPLKLMNRVRLSIDEEIHRPLQCPASDFFERWRAQTATKLAETKPVVPVTAGIPSLPISRIFDKTRVAAHTTESTSCSACETYGPENYQESVHVEGNATDTRRAARQVQHFR
jgi:hypothetical protein